jgi:predicted ATPase
MHAQTLSASNLRCFESASLNLSPGINLLVGHNNSGKSTLLQLLYSLQGIRLSEHDIRLDATRATASVRVVEADYAHLGARLAEHLRSRNLTSFDVNFDWRRGASDHHTLATGQRSDYDAMPNEQPNNFVAPYLATRRSSAINEQINSGAANALGGDLSNFMSKIDRVWTSPELQDKYKEACWKVLGLLVSTSGSPNGKKAGLEISAPRQQFINVQSMGAGTTNSIGLIVELLVATGNLFLIEELENDMHPLALKALLDMVVAAASAGNQFVISTHSNVVVRHLGGIEGTRVFHMKRDETQKLPTSTVAEVPNAPAERRALLADLGYDLLDSDLFDAWLILEESSAERIIRQFLIPWFCSELSGRIRTVAAKGAGDVEPQFSDLHRLFVFIHLQEVYRNRAWVLVDNDAAGQQAIRKLTTNFPTWPAAHFGTFDQPAFERFYPARFAADVDRVLAIQDKGAKRAAKERLVKVVVDWLDQNQNVGRQELGQSAASVIDQLRTIRDTVIGRAPAQ